MAKRAPILSADYNPVGSRLRSALATAPTPEPTPVDDTPSSSGDNENILELRPSATSKVNEVPLPVPTSRVIGRENKEAYIRFRCTDTERKKWHDVTREITGEHNQLSPVMRACLLILENSYEDLRKVSPDIQRMKRPSSQDAMGLALYEQRLAQYLFDAIKAAGRPKG